MQRIHVEQGRLAYFENRAYYLTRRQRRRELLRRWRAAVKLVVFVIELQKITRRRVPGWVTEWYRTSRVIVSFVGRVALAEEIPPPGGTTQISRYLLLCCLYA